MVEVQMFSGREKKAWVKFDISNRIHAKVLRVAEINKETPSQWISRMMQEDADAGFPVLNAMKQRRGRFNASR